LLLLNPIWVLQSQLTNSFYLPQKLVSKERDGAKVIKKYEIATTPHRRADQHEAVTGEDKQSSPTDTPDQTHRRPTSNTGIDHRAHRPRHRPEHTNERSRCHGGISG
jgi:hypothetical protein